MSYRNIVIQYRRILRKFDSVKNRLYFLLMGVKVGKRCCIHGKVGLTLAVSAKFTIGDNFYMSNGKHTNPLSGNNEGHFHVEENASLEIGNNVGISSSRIWCASSIIIKENVKIGGNVIIIDTDAHSLNFNERRYIAIDQERKADSPIIIEEDAFIGMNSIILKGVTIGARSIIGAGSVVTKSIPADCIAAGNPAKVIKQIQ